MSDLSLLSGEKRKLDFEAVRSFDRHTLLPSLNFETTVDWDL